MDLEQIDLTNSPDEEEGPPNRKRGQDQELEPERDTKKSKIMAFAKNVNAVGKNAALIHSLSTQPQIKEKPNVLLWQLHAERVARGKAGKPDTVGEKLPVGMPATTEGLSAPKPIPSKVEPFSLLTWNVWFNEEAGVEDRMMEIGDIVAELQYPTFLCFQEVTPAIAEIFAQHHFWRKYTACPWPVTDSEGPYFTMLLFQKDAFNPTRPSINEAFRNSRMNRGIRSVRGVFAGKEILIATSHLESPLGRGNMCSAERVYQAEKAIRDMTNARIPNIIYAGDMNWNPKADGAFPLQSGWADVWEKLQPGSPGYTYDGRKNPMLGPYNNLQGRLDRVVVKLADWEAASITMVGKDAIMKSAGVEAKYTKATRKGIVKVPLLPSDHFGLFTKFVPQ
eukprot:jgi/Botrbrau1/13300/Bobra.27_2s0020.2